MRRFPIVRLVFLIAALALAGCASEPGYRHASGADYYYGDAAGYDRGYDRGYVPDYIAYDAYYGALWPVYHSWYDPYFAPHFYYGVTWYPSNVFGLGGGWGWPYWAYSPWYGSWWDGYYDWRWWDRQRTREIHEQRFGSLRNERAAIAQLSRDDRRDGAARMAPGRLQPDSEGVRRRDDSGRFADAAPDRSRRDSEDFGQPVRGGRLVDDNRRQLPTRDVERDTPDPYYGLPREHRREPGAAAETTPFTRPRIGEPARGSGSRSVDRASPSRGDRPVRGSSTPGPGGSGPARTAPSYVAPPAPASVRSAPTSAPAREARSRDSDRR
ncbi:MAG: hypothetical protein ABI411_14360 [Tahibacter sp.]